MLERTTRINLLFDFYKGLLTEKQRLYTELYYYHDLSLSEIAEQYQVSRQAVFDNIKRAEHLLEHYETELQLLQKHTEKENLFEKVMVMLEQESVDKQQLKRVLADLKNVD